MTQDATDSGAGALRLRPEQPADLEFLLALYSSTRDEELNRTGWDVPTRDAFVRMQFTAQHAHYTAHNTNATFDIVELAGRPIGRLYVDRQAHEIRVMDIALLPAWRGRGIGTALMGPILNEAVAAGCPVTLHVEVWNRARCLYERLGFREVSRDQINAFMRREPQAYEKIA